MKADFQFAIQGGGKFYQCFQTEIVEIPGLDFGNKRLTHPQAMGKLSLCPAPLVAKVYKGVHNSKIAQLFFVSFPGFRIFEESLEDFLMRYRANRFYHCLFSQIYLLFIITPYKILHSSECDPFFSIRQPICFLSEQMDNHGILPQHKKIQNTVRPWS